MTLQTSDTNKAAPFFDSAFLAKLEQLHLLSRRIFRGKHHAERRSRRTGTSLEFADYRNYSPGDDLRNIDWNIFGRLDRLFLKMFEEQEDLHVHLLIDTSASMRWAPDGSVGATGPKLDHARRLAACLAYLGLANLDHVNIAPFAADLGPDLGLTRGKAQVHNVLGFLERLPAMDGTTSLAQAMRQFGARSRRKGLAIVLSDFLDPAGFENGLGFLVHRKFEIETIQILHPAEIEPGLSGDYRIVDSETGGALDVVADGRLVRDYRARLDGFIDRLERFCRSHAAGYLQTTSDERFEDIILQRLRERSMAR